MAACESNSQARRRHTWGFPRLLRDNPPYAVARGISRFKYQLLVFACSAFFTGLAGSVYAGNFKAIEPNLLQLPLLLFLISMMIVGGVGTVWGPFVGAVLLMGADELLKEDQFADARAMGARHPAGRLRGADAARRGGHHRGRARAPAQPARRRGRLRRAYFTA
ncbi:MAG: hypothetical protein FJX36_03755 [Alphaproteobacteria bacterium]|nr:hypothetical protein [Alphaproteobacteria bacterium]